MSFGNRDLKDRIRELEGEIEYLQQTKQTWISKHADAQEHFYRRYRAVRMEYSGKLQRLCDAYDDLFEDHKLLQVENEKLRKTISQLESENALHRISSKLGCGTASNSEGD